MACRPCTPKLDIDATYPLPAIATCCEQSLSANAVGAIAGVQYVAPSPHTAFEHTSSRTRS